MIRIDSDEQLKHIEAALDPTWQELVREMHAKISKFEVVQNRHRLKVHIPSGTPEEIRANTDPDSLFVKILAQHPEILKVPDHSNSHSGHDYFLSVKYSR